MGLKIGCSQPDHIAAGPLDAETQPCPVMSSGRRAVFSAGTVIFMPYSFWAKSQMAETS